MTRLPLFSLLLLLCTTSVSCNSLNIPEGPDVLPILEAYRDPDANVTSEIMAALADAIAASRDDFEDSDIYDQARINVHDAYAAQRHETREERAERREEPASPERRAERRKEVDDTESVPAMTDPDAGDEARALKREHKHIQEPIEGELSGKGIQRMEGGAPTYYVAYYLFTGGSPVAPREYAAYQDRTDWGSDWDRYAEDALLIDIVDSATGQLLWSGSGEGNTRGGGDDSDRMRGVKEAVRHIMRDLK